MEEKRGNTTIRPVAMVRLVTSDGSRASFKHLIPIFEGKNIDHLPVNRLIAVGFAMGASCKCRISSKQSLDSDERKPGCLFAPRQWYGV